MKKLVCFALTICMCFMLTSCGPEYEDTNGAENFELQTITDDDIIHLKTGSSGLAYRESELGGIVTTEYSAKNHNGVDQIYLTSFWGKSDIYVYVGHLNVKSGNFKLVVINNDEIIKEIPLDTFGEEFYFEDLEGDFSIHVAGESAAFEFHIQVN